MRLSSTINQNRSGFYVFPKIESTILKVISVKLYREVRVLYFFRIMREFGFISSLKIDVFSLKNG